MPPALAYLPDFRARLAGPIAATIEGMNFEEHYVRWSPTSVKGAYDLDDVEPPKGVKSFELHGGVSLKDRWGAGGTATLRNGNPKKPTIGDCVVNTNRLLFISERLKHALEAAGVSHVEYLPFTFTVKGAPIGLPYFMVNCLDRPACLDEKASGAVEDDILGDGIESIETIVMSSDPKRHLFQFARFEDAFIASMSLAQTLAKQQFTGIHWFALYDYDRFPEDKKGSPLSLRIRELSLEHFKGKPQAITALGAPAEVKRASATEVKAWLALAPGDGTFQRTTYIDGEDETWLDAFHDSPDDWPGFDPERYRAFGSDGQSNHYLIDLDQNGAVVFASHESGYGPDQFEVVAPSMATFAKLVKAK